MSEDNFEKFNLGFDKIEDEDFIIEDEDKDSIPNKSDPNKSDPNKSDKDKSGKYKPGSRLTIISVFVLILIIAAIGLSYMDMKKRFAIVQNRGTSDALNLSKDFDNKLSTFRQDQKNILKNIDNKFVKLEEKTSFLDKDIKNLDKGIKKAQKNLKNIKLSKADKKEFSLSMNKIKKKFTLISKSQKDLAKEISGINEKFNKKADGIEKKIKEYDLKLSELVSSMKRGQKLTEKLEAENYSLKRKLETMEKNMEKTFFLFQKKLNSMKKRSSAAKPDTDIIIEEDIK